MKSKKFAATAATLALLMLIPLSMTAAVIPNLDIEILRNKVHHAGTAVMLDFVFTNNSNKSIDVFPDTNPFETHDNVVADGDRYSLKDPGTTYFTIPAGESVKRTLYVDNLPYNTTVLESIKLNGRSSVTTQSNPYGEFTYKFTDVAIPPFKASNREKCYFLDTEFDLSVDKIIPNGKDLEVIFTLTNNGKRDKYVSCNDTGKATDIDGDEYTVEDPNRYTSTEISSGESARGKIIVRNCGNCDLKKIRIVYNVQEQGGDRMSYPVLLQLDGITAR